MRESQLGPQQGGLKGGASRLGQRPGYGTEEEEDASLKRPESPSASLPDSKSESPGLICPGLVPRGLVPPQRLCDLGPCAARPEPQSLNKGSAWSRGCSDPCPAGVPTSGSPALQLLSLLDLFVMLGSGVPESVQATIQECPLSQ